MHCQRWLIDAQECERVEDLLLCYVGEDECLLCPQCLHELHYCIECGEQEEEERYHNGYCETCYWEYRQQEDYVAEMAEQGYDEQGRAIDDYEDDTSEDDL